MFGLSIRNKLLLVSLTLLLIPWMGYQYVREMKSFALQGQEDALLLTAGAVATVLHDRPELFTPKKTGAVISEAGDLQAQQLQGPLRVDGKFEDWGNIADLAGHYSIPDLLRAPENHAEDLSFDHALGSWGRHIYAMFQIHDDIVVARDTSYRRLDNSDHLRIYLRDEDNLMTRYVLTASKPGRMDVFTMDENWVYPLTGDPVYSIVGFLREADDGYSVELRIPRQLVSAKSRLAIAVADVDDKEGRKVETVLGTSPAETSTELGRVLIPSPEIERILQGLDRSGTRIWIVDRNKFVRAVVGDLSEDDNVVESLPGSNMKTLQKWMDRLLAPVYSLILKPPTGEFTDLPDDTVERNEEVLFQVLEGMPATDRRPSLDRQAQLLMAAHPVWHADDILGAVIVERSSNSVVALQNRLLQNVIAVSVIVFALVAAALMTFAWRLTRRIRRLSKASGLAISPKGKLREGSGMPDTAAGDEIGDLSRSINGMLSRLSHYTRYLEQMPDTLAHELNNPLNVVNSSLENLASQHPDIQQSKYMTRAQKGVNRLGSLLASLTEAANLEEALKTEDHEIFNLNEMLSQYIEGYGESHPEFSEGFIMQLPEHQVMIKGSPDHIAQMLDKLVDNAVDFSQPGQPVSLSLSVWNHEATIKVMNIGKTLPSGMEERLFDPMVSLRQTGTVRSHLGMGLHIVRLIVDAHGGTTAARNNEAANGVVFEVRLPALSGSRRYLADRQT